MARWTRDEDRSYAFAWFVAAGLFAGVSVLAVWDDGVRRAPWKRDQQAFFEIESDLADKNLDFETRAFDRTSKARYEKLGEDLQKLQSKKASAEFRRWEEELARLDEDYATAEEDYTFAKSDQDEVYYYRTNAEYEVELAPPATVEARRAEVARFREQERRLKGEMDAATRRMHEIDARRQPLRDRMFPTTDGIARIERDRSGLRRALEDAERRVQNAAELSEEILQVVYRWRIDKSGAFVEEVDRCQTCHRGVDSANYTDPELPAEFRTHPNRQFLLATHPVDKFGCTPCHLGQGRSTEFSFAHSRTPPVLEREGEEMEVSWHHEGDHYWEEPMLPVGLLWEQPIDADTKDFEVSIAGNATPLALEEKTYSDLVELTSAIQTKLQTAIPAPAADAPHRDRFLVYLDGSHVGVRLVREMTDRDAVPTAAPNFSITWTDPALGRLLGFERPMRAAAEYVAERSPEPTIRARGDRGTDGLQVPGPGTGEHARSSERERLIVSAPFIESGCLRCHKGDVDLRPFRSVAQMVVRDDAAITDRLHEIAEDAGKHADAVRIAAEHHEPAPEPPTIPPEPEPSIDPDRLTDLAPTLSEGRFLFRKLNCTGCHILDGFPGNRDAGPTLDHVAGKVSPEWLVNWLRYPREWRSGTRMPNFWPVPIDPETKMPAQAGTNEYRAWEHRRDEEVTAIAAYLLEKSTPNYEPAPVSPTATPEAGRQLFETMGCRGCHSVAPPNERAGAFATRERDRAPNLHDIGDKVNAEWLAAWIENPAHLWSGTRMPNLRLTREESQSVAAYLMTLKDPETRFPDVPAALRTPAGRAPLVDRGHALIANYGCFGCHQIDGFQDFAPIAPELNGHAKKDVTTLDFGYAVPNHHEQTWETFVTWKLDAPRMYGRELSPQTPRGEGHASAPAADVRPIVPLRMADFDLSPHEIRSLLVFLKGCQEDVVSAPYRPSSNPRIAQIQEGRQIVDDYNCRGCHIVEGRGGDIRVYFGERPEQLVKAPPLLRAQGFRVQPEWFYSFLRAPTRIRPWIDVRMPTFNFTNEQVTAVVAYFSAWDDQPFPFQRQPRVPPPADQLLQTHRLVARLQCTTGCHLLSDDIPPGTDTTRLAPNLNLARDRLRPDWIVRWLENPERIMPGTRMPSFFAEPFGPSPYHDTLAGDSQATMAALRDYLMNLDVVDALVAGGGGAAPAAPVAAPGATAAPARTAMPGRTAMPARTAGPARSAGPARTAAPARP